jgi:hypothetical protein
MTKQAFLLASVVLPFVAACSGNSSPAASSSPSATNVSAKLTASQTSFHFPDTTLGQSASSPTIQLSATGSGSLVIASVTSSNPTEFVAANASGCVGMSLAAGGGAACAISVRFQPATPGVRSAQVTIVGSGGDSIVLDVYGSGLVSDGSGGSGDVGAGGGGGGASGGSFPQAPCVPNHTGGISVSLINTTTIAVQVTITSSTTLTVSLAPGAIAIVPLTPGNYTFNGTAPSTPNANFIPSSWSVVNGCDYLLSVVVVTR